MRQKPSFAWHFRKLFCLEIHMGLGRHTVYAHVEPFVAGPSVTCTVHVHVQNRCSSGGNPRKMTSRPRQSGHTSWYTQYS